MALSGSVSTSKYDGRYYTVSWTATQSVANNTSTVKWTLKAVGGDVSWYAERTLKVVLGGSTVYSKTARVERYTGTIASGSKTITHNSAGEASFSISIEGAVYVSTVNCTGSGKFTLDTIPRKSTLSVGNGTLDTAQTLTVTRKSTNFTHTITAKCGSASTTIVTKSTDTSISFTPPIAWASQNTTGTSVSVTYTITTYSGSTSVGSNSYTKTCTIPASVKPSCTVTVSDATGYLATYGAYLKGLSKLKVVVTPTTSYGSAIASYSTVADNATYTASSFTTGVLSSSGTLTVKSTVTDKRGRSGTASASVSVLDYANPVISGISVLRCDEDGTENDKGEYTKVTFSASVTSLNNKNTATYRLQYKKSSDSSYTTVMLDDYKNNYSVENATYIFEADSGSSYEIIVTVADNFKSTDYVTSVSTGFTLLHFSASGKGMSMGKIVEIDNILDIGFLTRFYGGFLMVLLEDGTDLNDIKTPNFYHGNGTKTAGYVNSPITSDTTFTLEVFSAGGGGQIFQRLTSCSKTGPTVYMRFYYAGSWGDWLET